MRIIEIITEYDTTNQTIRYRKQDYDDVQKGPGTSTGLPPPPTINP
jgi:hypothetical protein